MKRRFIIKLTIKIVYKGFEFAEFHFRIGVTGARESGEIERFIKGDTPKKAGDMV